MLIDYSYYSSCETIRDDYSHALGGHGLTAADLALGERIASLAVAPHVQTLALLRALRHPHARLDPQRAGGREYGQKADMWSLGCVLYEMAALKPAFDARSMPELKRKVARGQVDMSKIPNSYDPEVKKLIGNMLQVRACLLLSTFLE